MSWSLDYHRLDFSIQFAKPVVFENFSVFLFRSLLGKELFRLICPFKKKICDSCSLRFKCAYSYVFESPVTKDNPILFGRNFASHPFVMSTDVGVNKSTETLKLTMLLIGDAAEYIPIIFWSLIRAGQHGIFKARVPFKINALFINGQSAYDGEKLSMPKEKHCWTLNESPEQRKGQLFLEFLTPVRFKKDGRYIKQLSFEDVIQAALRRLEILSATYGSLEFKKIAFPQFVLEHEHGQMSWKDYDRWSARQKQKMRMGGSVGLLTASGVFSQTCLSLLEGAQLFHIGKNTSFGLGKIKYTFVEGV